ncbi:hypothetical protein TNCV_4253821 [Trichonephila clavipes]|nr:hypothetical protein TNCV_4253821 [Trichonephila clavipes]
MCALIPECHVWGAMDWTWWTSPLAPRSPDLSTLDCLLWKHLKNLVYVTPLGSDENLVARISKAAARVR